MFRRTRRILGVIRKVVREIRSDDKGTPDIYSGGRYTGGTGYTTSDMQADQATTPAPPAPAPASPLAEPQVAAGTALVRFIGPGLDEPVEARIGVGRTLLDITDELGIELNHYCGGMASCGSCRVEPVAPDGLSSASAMESATLEVVREGPADRLGCQCRLEGDAVIRIPQQ